MKPNETPPPADDQEANKPAGAGCMAQLVRLYDWLRFEESYGETIACGGIFPAKEIKVGQRWQGTGNHVVTVSRVRPIKSGDGEIIDHEVYYQWRDSSEEKSHSKLAFAFQCRYCLILPNAECIHPESKPTNSESMSFHRETHVKKTRAANEAKRKQNPIYQKTEML